MVLSVRYQSVPCVETPGLMTRIPGPVWPTSRKRQLFPFYSSCCLSQQRVWATHPVDVPKVLHALGTLGAISLTLPFLSPKPSMPLDELEAFGLVMGQAGLEQHRVHPELSIQEGHVAIHLDKEVDTLVTLMKVGIIM